MQRGASGRCGATARREFRRHPLRALSRGVDVPAGGVARRDGIVIPPVVVTRSDRWSRELTYCCPSRLECDAEAIIAPFAADSLP